MNLYAKIGLNVFLGYLYSTLYIPSVKAYLKYQVNKRINEEISEKKVDSLESFVIMDQTPEFNQKIDSCIENSLAANRTLFRNIILLCWSLPFFSMIGKNYSMFENINTFTIASFATLFISTEAFTKKEVKLSVITKHNLDPNVYNEYTRVTEVIQSASIDIGHTSLSEFAVRLLTYSYDR